MTEFQGDIGNAALFLFSPAASWITGQVLVRHSLLHRIYLKAGIVRLMLQAVDGGEHHMRTSSLPYPQAVLDPKSLMEEKKSKAKL